MSKKHNTKHNRGRSGYGRKVKEQGSSRQADPILSDGKRASQSR